MSNYYNRRRPNRRQNDSGVNPGGPPLPLVSIVWNYGGPTTSRITVSGRAVIPPTAAAAFRAVWLTSSGSFREIPALSLADEGTDGSGNRQFAVTWSEAVPDNGASLLWPWGQRAIQGAGGGGLGTLLWDGQITEILTWPGQTVAPPSLTGFAPGSEPEQLVFTADQECEAAPGMLADSWVILGVEGGVQFVRPATSAAMTGPNELTLSFGVDMTAANPYVLTLVSPDQGLISLTGGQYLRRLSGGAVWAA